MTDETRVESRQLGTRVGELRRLTIMFCDVVGSTELSGRQEPETYRELMRTYRAVCRQVIESRFDGHVVQLTGDGTLSVFGFPVAHENDAERAVRAGLALVRAVRALPPEATPGAGDSLDVRVAVHHGPVYLDLDEGDIYGLAANVGARLQTIADPGAVVVSDAVRRLVEHHFEIEPGEARLVKGVAEPLQPFRVVGERPARVRTSWATPLLERDDELGRLRRAWARVAACAADRPGAALVRGDAGVGKTRLLAALADDVRAADAPVIELHGSALHRATGFHPVRGLVESRCGIGGHADGGERLRCLTREVTGLGLDRDGTVPLMAPVLGIDPSVGYEPAATEGRRLQEQVSRAVLGYLVACTRGRPALLVAEDLHWFDDTTRGLLVELARSGPGSILLVATSRDEEEGPWETIDLRPLTQAGRLALVDALEDGLSEQNRLALAARSGGIPLYLEQLVRAGGGHDPAAAGGVAPVPGSVPAALYEPLVAHLYATPAALPVAGTAAAAGHEVDRSLLATVMAMPAGELDAALGALADARVLEPIEGHPVRYRFRHELLREVAYELQPPSRRREVHNRLCDLLTRDEPGDWHVLALHFERAERPREAAVAHQNAAEMARRRGALGEARSHLTRAIDLVVPLAPDEGRDHLEVQLRLRRGFLASAEGAGGAGTSADFARCLELASADPRGADMFSTLISLWAHHLSRAELDRARQVSETLRTRLGERDFFGPQNLAGFGMLDWFAGRFADAAGTLAAAAADLAETGREDEVAAAWFVPNDPTAAMYVHLALARFMSGDEAGAGESLTRARDVAARLDFPQGPWSAAYADWLGSWIWIEAGRPDLASAAIAALHASSARHGFDNWALIAATQTAVQDAMAALASRTAEAAALAAHADALGAHVGVWQALGLRVFLPFYLTTAGALLAASGDADGARARYDESLRLATATGMHFYDAETMRRVAHLAVGRDRVVAELRTALDVACFQGARPFEQRIARDLGDLLGGAASVARVPARG
jgi:class 3 adenylate cyclase